VVGSPRCALSWFLGRFLWTQVPGSVRSGSGCLSRGRWATVGGVSGGAGGVSGRRPFWPARQAAFAVWQRRRLVFGPAAAAPGRPKTAARQKHSEKTGRRGSGPERTRPASLPNRKRRLSAGQQRTSCLRHRQRRRDAAHRCPASA